MGVYNQTDQAMTLTASSYQYVWCNGTQDPTAPRAGTLSITIPARATRTWELNGDGGLNGGIDFYVVQNFDRICGIHGQFSGKTANGTPVQAPFTASLKRPSHLTRPVSDAYMTSVLKTLDARGQMGATHVISHDQVDKLAREKRLAVSYLSPYVFTGSGLVGAAGGAPGEQECFPGSNDPAPFAGFTCQATDEFLEDLPYLANAFAGDIVESAACGTVGSLLRAVQPAQHYTHVGIMTSHNDRIRHSTLETDRLDDHKQGSNGSNGALPSTLRYARPGVLPQSIYEAYEGGWWQDDEYPGEEYLVSGFNDDPAGCETDENLTSPLIITGAWSKLADRKRIADEAAKIKGHYRVYGYSQGAIAENPAFNQPGTDSRATVCSTFVWAAARQAGFSALEGTTLETSDVSAGAFRDPSTLDGMYYYTAQERQAAAAALYSVIYTKVQKKTFGPRGDIDLDAADNWANQIVNCFASDSCLTSDKDSTAWKSTGDGRTVSPDNLLYWDGPLYGETKLLSFRSGQFRRKHVWRAGVGTGTLTATVRTSTGSAAAGAKVVITGLSHTATASSAGKVTLTAVGGGCHQVVAMKDMDGQLVRGEAKACITSGRTTDIIITLANPALKMRKVIVRGTLHVYDDHPWPLGGSSRDVAVAVTGNVRPDAGLETEGIGEVCEGNEVVVRGANVKFQLRTDGSVDVVLTATLYEGESCKTTDKQDHEFVHINVPRDAQDTIHLKLKNTRFGGGDYATFNLEVSNLQDS